MARSDAETVEEYLQELPEDRRETVGRVRDVILQNLPDGYIESMNWGMISYAIPLERYPDTYNGQPLGYAALASQKNYVSLYLHSVYGDSEREAWLKEQFAKQGKTLNMGKSCIRFKHADDIPLEEIGELVAGMSPDEYIERYEASRRR